MAQSTTLMDSANTVVEGGTTVTVMAFFSDAMIRMIPWLGAAFPLLLLDLLYGVKAAKHRGDKVRVSTAIRRSVDKAFGYLCWVSVSIMLASLFEISWLDKVVLGMVYLNEIVSIISNYLEPKGFDFSTINFWKILVRKIADKFGVEVSQEETDAIVHEKPSDSKGRFTKKK